MHFFVPVMHLLKLSMLSHVVYSSVYLDILPNVAGPLGETCIQK